MDHFFLAFSLILWAVILTLGAMKILKQPMIIWYILAGTVITLLFPHFFQGSEDYNQFSEIGIAFLLFIVGMELNPAMLKKIWIKTIIIGILQVILTTVLGIWVWLLWNFDLMTSIYLGFGFAFSSTIVVLKLLDDKEDMDSIYGRQAVGILVLQDIMVMLFMLTMATISSFEGNADKFQIIGILSLKLFGLGIGLYLVTKYILPTITKKIAESQEFLFLFSIGWCFIVASIFYLLGFGLEIGALVAGVALATSPYRFEITSRIKVLKDFFIVMYFVLLGSHVSFSEPVNWWMVVSFLFVVMLIKPYLIMWLMKFIGHTKKNGFFTGTALGQMSEFSFIIISMGVTSRIIQDASLITVVTIAGILSIVFSSYLTVYNHSFYNKIPNKLKQFIPWLKKKLAEKEIGQENDILIFGFGRFGSNLYDHFHKKYKILVVDEHPAIINHLNTQGINCLYGDAMDLEFLREINLSGTKMILSTIRDSDVNIAILKVLKEKKSDLIVVCIANHIHEAISLYEKGADYVIMPHYIGADHTSIMLEEFGLDVEKFLKNKSQQVESLKKKSNDLLLEELMKK